LDLKSYDRRDGYTKARDEMAAASDISWYVALSEDKKLVHLKGISHLLKRIRNKAVPTEEATLTKRKIGHYQAADLPTNYVPEFL
jgi:predicted nucleotidyltransferase